MNDLPEKIYPSELIRVVLTELGVAAEQQDLLARDVEQAILIEFFVSLIEKLPADQQHDGIERFRLYQEQPSQERYEEAMRVLQGKFSSDELRELFNSIAKDILEDYLRTILA